MKDARKTLLLAAVGAGLVAALAIASLLASGGTDSAARAQAPLVVGFDMDPFSSPANTCPGDGAHDCAVGTVERCVSVPNANGQTFTVDTFITGLPNGFQAWTHNLNFPDMTSPAKLTISAEVLIDSTVNLSAQSTGSTPIPAGDGVPDTNSNHNVGVGEFLTSETTPPFTQGVLGRFTFTVGSGAISDIYGLTLDPTPISAYMDSDGFAYSIDQTWDFSFSPEYGIIALGLPCPTTALPVGGLAELPDAASSSGPPYAALAGGLGATLAALTAGAWHARRRWAR